MNLLDIAASFFPPEINCPGMTAEQKKAFLKKNRILGGRVNLEHPEQLGKIQGQFIIGGEITSRDGVAKIRGNISIGKNTISIE